MADIDRRVRLLTDVLMVSGFSWLAAEIFEVLEAGKEATSTRDENVPQQRAAMNSRSPSAPISQVVDTDRLSLAAMRPEERRTPFEPDEQVNFATNYFINRLTSSVKMMRQGRDLLAEVVEMPVGYAVEVGTEVLGVDVDRATGAVNHLLEMRGDLLEWLMSHPTEDEG